MDERKKDLLKHLPKIDELLLALEKKGAFSQNGRDYLVAASRAVVEELREAILASPGNMTEMPRLDDVAGKVEERLTAMHRFRLRKVVNATGVVLHTNLGRSPLCGDALERLMEVAGSYSNLEYDLEKGERGLRYSHVRELLCLLSGAEEALVVNNNAAAVLLVLDTLARGREAIVSRGELVEIGGEFRIPDIMEKSGAILREVGTTNRTRQGDYERAVSERTGLIMKVHTSNFRIVGFTEEVSLEALVSLGKAYGIPVMDDLGSGCMIDLASYGLGREPTVRSVMNSGVDVATISGDKLLGGPQAGIILGKKEIMADVMRNPLNRALRIDKLTLAALEGTLVQYLNPQNAVRAIRTLHSLTEPLPVTAKRAKRLAAVLRRAGIEGLEITLKKGFSAVGGGALPMQEIETMLVAMRYDGLSSVRLEERLRCLDVPVIARIDGGEVLLDVRTVDDGEFPLIRDGMKIIAGRSFEHAATLLTS
ncbi:MAG TPA: L-seryl-tRNA(Sec) selenium transferase [Syntrophales bacterium]|nr:L-seryl-tRNA(Sec) selenium transferase [Syntrophales bacterium]